MDCTIRRAVCGGQRANYRQFRVDLGRGTHGKLVRITNHNYLDIANLARYDCLQSKKESREGLKQVD
jgi:uncharacterized protein YprB with RNaseH-like and TPR domain